MTPTQLAELPLRLSTAELSAVLKVKEQTIRAGLCRDGVYMHLRPVKLPNGRLVWDADAVERLLSGEVAK